MSLVLRGENSDFQARTIIPRSFKPNAVDIYSDLACPWCYVGKRKFEVGLEKFRSQNPDVPVDVVWHPYMIDPATAQQGEEYLAYNRRRWGGDGWTHDLRSAGRAVGCPFANWKTWPHTLLAHCLVLDATKHGKGDLAVQRLFELCYEQGQNISDVGVVVGLAKELGLPDPDVVASGEYRRLVKSMDETAKRELDIHGVPYFIVDDKTALSGAQNPQTFVAALEKHAH
eukprot:CAMPEP_0196655544 /NCGR_PEP_ID=MMETSP1086-20130531/5304_1 /TAXON_ID=77921 /ORGANISM="Cyanoptyche  gloeocystis , Strain SAG4.97" /LENGTH=227 /DNA_ID=CAMNT_0041987913 /DNA_START=1 /DNA_END=685 /DNA_ORIENTATION=+